MHQHKIKIALIGSRGLPPSYGGTEVYVEQLALNLAAYGDEIWIFGCTPPGKSKTGPKQCRYPKNIHLVNTPTLSVKFLDNFIRSLIASLQVIRYPNIEIVEYTNYGPAFFAFLPKIFGKKIVVSIRALDANRSKWGAFARLFLKLCEASSVWYADKMTTNSKQAAFHFKTRFGREPVFFPNGVDTPQEPRDSTILKANCIGSMRYILFSGRLVPEKGVHTLLEAFNMASLPDIKLVIAGAHASNKAYLKTLHSLANDRVIFVGHQSGDSLATLYRHAAVFVLPSIVEGMSNSLLSAMAHSRPVIVSDIAENIFVVRGALIDNNECSGAAITFQAGDSQSLAYAIEGIFRSPDELELRGAALRKHVIENFDWTHTVAGIRNIYLEAICPRSISDRGLLP